MTEKIYEPIDRCTCFDPVFDPPAEQLSTGTFSAPEPTLENTAFYTTDANGVQYFHCGSTRIRVTEHFTAQGKEMEHFMEDAIRFAATRQKMSA